MLSRVGMPRLPWPVGGGVKRSRKVVLMESPSSVRAEDPLEVHTPQGHLQTSSHSDDGSIDGWSLSSAKQPDIWRGDLKPGACRQPQEV